MKPARFEYAAPESLDEALGLLDEGSKALAGGQSLVPLLNFRLARPERLVDLNRIPGCDHVREEGGSLRIGMLARQVQLTELEAWPLLRDAVDHVGHPQTRNRGTVCGSAAHADPAAELPAALLALAARFHVRSASGTRVVAAEDFFVGYLTTVLEPDELLVEIEVPPHPPQWRFVEYARTHGDWAMVGAAVAGDRTALFATGDRPRLTRDLAVVDDPWKRAFLEEALA
ncbi:MAG TPA: FAD binding domain-containing protein [Gaiellaceae bacterium]|nr:FAD binding domain-containing protein [Gaiellaceae bacterium]